MLIDQMFEQALRDEAADLRVVHVRHFRYGHIAVPMVGPDGLRAVKHVNPKGGATLVVMEDSAGRCYAGVSCCSKKDPFNKRIGRELAIQRARQAKSLDKMAVVPKRHDGLGGAVLQRTPQRFFDKMVV